MLDWTQADTGVLVCEASSLGLAVGEAINNAKLPDGSTGHRWVAHHRDGEITHWTLSHRGTTYEVYNT